MTGKRIVKAPPLIRNKPEARIISHRNVLRHQNVMLLVLLTDELSVKITMTGAM